MDKKKKKALYDAFEPLRKAWQEAQGKMEMKAMADIAAIINDGGPINLRNTDFGHNQYLFRSCDEILQCEKIYMEKGKIFAMARNADGGEMFLDWCDLTQDVETFNDFMDAVYGIEN